MQSGILSYAALLQHELHVTCQRLQRARHQVSHTVAAAVHTRGRRDVQGLSKAGLMGFCDISPGEAKGLRVLFLWRGQPHAATLLDKVSTGAA